MTCAQKYAMQRSGAPTFVRPFGGKGETKAPGEVRNAPGTEGFHNQSRERPTWSRRMTTKRMMAAVAGGVLVGLAGAAVASNFTTSKQSDFFAPGKHQFYVWCAGSSDYEATV